MCRNIVTSSIHCNDVSHREYNKVRCKKFWLADWEEAAGCKKQMHLAVELADECVACRQYGPPVQVEPWEAEPEVSSHADNASEQDSSSSDSRIYGDSSDSDEEAIDRSELVDEDDTTMTEEEGSTTNDGEPISCSLVEEDPEN